jgi:hypothetical protein
VCGSAVHLNRRAKHFDPTLQPATVEGLSLIPEPALVVRRQAQSSARAASKEP